MSTLSDAGKLLKGSEGESKYNVRAIGGVALGLGLLVLFINVLGGNDGGIGQRLAAQRDMPVATAAPAAPTPTMYVFAIEEDPPTPTPWPTPIIIIQEKVVEVPIEVTREVYYTVPGPEVEVTRIVEVAPISFPTVTPIPLAPGSIKVCASVEGASALYIGNEGVVSGGCKIYTFGVGQTTILVQVNK